MLQYYKQEMRDLRNPESGRVREVCKVLLDKTVTADELTHSGLMASGSGSHRVYILGK